MSSKIVVHKVLIIPESDTEREYSEMSSYDAALAYQQRNEHPGEEFAFLTAKERDAFVIGYEAGIGWLGEGLYFCKEVGRLDEKCAAQS